MASLAPSASPVLRLLFGSQPVVPISNALKFALPIFCIQLGIPSLPDIWEGILRAVPKKKQSHSRKRMRQLAGKALKDVQSLNKCSGCGRTKRQHVVCRYCMQDIRNLWLSGRKSAAGETSP